VSPVIAKLKKARRGRTGSLDMRDLRVLRQRHAIQDFAKRAGFGIVEEFYDAAVSGADPIETRAGFASLLDRIEGNGVRTVIVEDASRFARELMAQELGITLLISRGVRLLTASGDDLTASDDPSRKMMRQIAGRSPKRELGTSYWEIADKNLILRIAATAGRCQQCETCQGPH
jgi:hypothetical protein